jgi:pyrroloquinoline quinone biosynthesis protein B
VRGSRGPWFLLNASPDLRQQLALLPTDPVEGLRSTPLGGILLTDAEIDHTAGLMLLRESSVPLRVYSSEEVRGALTDHYPLLTMLERYCGVEWAPLELGHSRELAGSSLEVEPFSTGGDAPLYIEGVDEPTSIGLTIHDREGGGRLTYAPSLAALDDETAERFRRSDAVLVDGTFWTGDELIALGISARDGADMGHLPISGSGGSLAALAALGSRTIYIHVNNTNPILLEDSPEHATVLQHGLEIAYDGLEVEL